MSERTCHRMDWHPASTWLDSVLRSGFFACRPWYRVIFCFRSWTWREINKYIRPKEGRAREGRNIRGGVSHSRSPRSPF